MLRKDITRWFKAKFESDCISLLLDGYRSLRQTGRDLREANENNITAQLVGFMKDNPKRKSLQISVHREDHIDTKDTYEGIVNADESARIDVKYVVWNSIEEHEYYMEAKNIGQNNWKKSTAGITVDARRLRKRYLETGVTNFTSGRYPFGALIGYVLEGEPTEIVGQINDLLKSLKKEKEVLVKVEGDECDFLYVSTHVNSKITLLKHFFLNFVN